MNAVTVTEAKQDLEKLIDQVIADAEPTIVVTDGGQRVVILPLDEFNGWRETLYLLGNPANANHIRQSIGEFQAGHTLEHELPDV